MKDDPLMSLSEAVNAMLYGHQVCKADGPLGECFVAVKSSLALRLYRLTEEGAELWFPTHREVLQDRYLLVEPPRQLKCAPGCFDIVTALKLLSQGYGITRDDLNGVIAVQGAQLVLKKGGDSEPYLLGINDFSARNYGYDDSGAAAVRGVSHG